jgi:hypothetical protein
MDLLDDPWEVPYGAQGETGKDDVEAGVSKG